MKYGYRVPLVAVLTLALLPLMLSQAATGEREPQQAIAYADPAIQATRDALDRPVEQNQVDRTWFWGPEPVSEGLSEPYLQAPGGERLVQYIDKARFEITDPDADPTSPWYVTTGLLVREMITGRIQVGDNSYESHDPANIPMAGDPDTSWPTYAGFASSIDQMYADRSGEHITNVLLPNGVTQYQDAADDPNTEAVHYVTYEIPSGTVGYNIPRAFWDFLNSPGIRWNGESYVESDPLINWQYVMGYPISDPFWVSVLLDEEPTWVMVQPFERRVLTYTPTNDPAWQVEMGNVGSHYFHWRYPDATPPPAATATPTAPATPTPTETPQPEPTATAQPTATATPEPQPEPVAGGDFFAMNPDDQWTYRDPGTGETVDVRVVGGTTDFIPGQFLLMKEEVYPDGSSRRTFWQPTEQVLWLHGYETYTPEGVRSQKVIFDPPLRYMGRTFETGFGWGTTTTVSEINEREQRRSNLMLYEFEIVESGDVTVPAGTFFDAYRIRVTVTPTDTRNATGETQFVNEFWFKPDVGIIRDERAGDRILELVEIIGQE